jgi:hypothetical protein
MIGWILIVGILIISILLWKPIVKNKFTDNLLLFLKGFIPILLLIVVIFGIADSIYRNINDHVVESINVTGYNESGNSIPDAETWGNTFIAESKNLFTTIGNGIDKENKVRLDRGLMLAQGDTDDAFYVAAAPIADINTVGTVKKPSGIEKFGNSGLKSVDVGGITIPVDTLLRPLLRVLGANPLRVSVHLGSMNPHALIFSEDGKISVQVSEIEARCMEGEMDACINLTSGKSLVAPSSQPPQLLDSSRVKRLFRTLAAKFEFLDKTKIVFPENDTSWLVTVLQSEARGLLHAFWVDKDKDKSDGEFILVESAQLKIATRAKQKFEAAYYLAETQHLAAFPTESDRRNISTFSLLGMMAALGAERRAITHQAFVEAKDKTPNLDDGNQNIADRFTRCQLLIATFRDSKNLTSIKDETHLSQATDFFSKIQRKASALWKADSKTPLDGESADAETRKLVNQVLDYLALVQRADSFECRGQYQLALRDDDRIQKLIENSKDWPKGTKSVAQIRHGQRLRELQRRLETLDDPTAKQFNFGIKLLEQAAKDSTNKNRVIALIQLARDYTSGPTFDFQKANNKLKEALDLITVLENSPEKGVDVDSLKLFVLEGFNSLFISYERWLKTQKIIKTRNKILNQIGKIGFKSDILVKEALNTVILDLKVDSIQFARSFNAMKDTFVAQRDLIENFPSLLSKENPASDDIFLNLFDCLGYQAREARSKARILLQERRATDMLKPSDLLTEALLEGDSRQFEQPFQNFKFGSCKFGK